MKGCLKWILYGFGALVVLGIIGALFSSGNRNGTPTRTQNTGAQVAVVENDTPESPTATPAPPTATPEWMAPSYEEMCNNSDLTDIQQEDLAASMAGKKVVGWTGKVYDVERDGDSYKIQVDVAGGIFFVRQVEILGVPRDVAAPLKVEQMITFDGTIKSVEMFAGDMCNPINIIDATVTPQ